MHGLRGPLDAAFAEQRAVERGIRGWGARNQGVGGWHAQCPVKPIHLQRRAGVTAEAACPDCSGSGRCVCGECQGRGEPRYPPRMVPGT